MDRATLDAPFGEVALSLGVLSEAQQAQLVQAIASHPAPPASGQLAVNMGFFDGDVKTAVLMAQSGERMLQALEVAHAPQDDPTALQKASEFGKPERYKHIGKVEGEDAALTRAQQQWQQAENYAIKRRTPGVEVTPEQDAAAREIIVARAEQSYRFAAAWLKVRAKEIAQQNPDQANAMHKAGTELEISAQGIFVEARGRLKVQVPDETRATPEQYELSVAQYRERERAKAEGKSWVKQTGRGGEPQQSAGGSPGASF